MKITNKAHFTFVIHRPDGKQLAFLIASVKLLLHFYVTHHSFWGIHVNFNSTIVKERTNAIKTLIGYLLICLKATQYTFHINSCNLLVEKIENYFKHHFVRHKDSAKSKFIWAVGIQPHVELNNGLKLWIVRCASHIKSQKKTFILISKTPI